MLLKTTALLFAGMAMASAQVSVTSLTCTPTTVIPGASAACRVRLSLQAPLGGWTASLSSSSPNLTVPSLFNILATASVFDFYATASPQASVAETVTVKVSVLTGSSSAKITINPNPAFYLHSNNTEIGMYNGAVVRPAVAPAGWSGNLTLRGSGYLAFDPVYGSSGMSMHQGGSQTSNTAFINFSGSGFDQVFDTQGEISFLLKSAYSFAERQSVAYAPRYAFEVYDDTASQFHFMTYTSGGRLTFAYSTRGATNFYTVPAGREDILFGKGVTAKIRIAWSGSTNSLYINDQLIRTSSIWARLANWSARSALTIGAHTVRASGGYASDDAIAEFKIR